MKLDTPMIAIIISIVFFYLKMVYTQWRKARSAAKKTNIEIAKARKQGKAPKVPEKPIVAQLFSARIGNWYIAGAAFLVVIIGFVLSGVGSGAPVNTPVIDWWWVLISAGIIGFSFAFK